MKVTINRIDYEWTGDTITGAEVKRLSGLSGVVNRLIGPKGEDPEILDDELVSLKDGRGASFIIRNPRTAAS